MTRGGEAGLAVPEGVSGAAGAGRGACFALWMW